MLHNVPAQMIALVYMIGEESPDTLSCESTSNRVAGNSRPLRGFIHS